MNKKLTNLCIVNTEYTLLMYLVHMYPDAFSNTFFIFGDSIKKEIADRFEHKMYVSSPTILKSRFLQLLYFKFKFNNFPRSRYNIYCQDHLLFAQMIIGSSSYTLIEDSPGFFDMYIESKKYFINMNFAKSLNGKILKFLFGNLVTQNLGHNSNCINIIIATPERNKFILSKNHTLCNMYEIWINLKKEYRERILSIFDVTNNDIMELSKRKHILFTQPLTEIKGISIKKQIEIYRKILSKYDQNEIILKTHPRDIVNYEIIFPNTYIFKKDIPSQLLDLIGCKFEKAITIFSSAVTSFSYNIQIDWYGTEIDEMLFKSEGHIAKPQIKY